MAPANRTLTLVPGLLVGQAQDPARTTGVTVVLFPRTGRGGVEVRGGAPGTVHTDALGPLGCFGILSAVFLSGGSLYGIDAVRGIRRRVLERGEGMRLWGSHDRLAGVSGAVLFDLPRDRALEADYEELGYQATERANGRPLERGNQGAGTGALVGKFLGRDRAMKGGIGSSARTIPQGGHVGALVAANSVGNVVDPVSGRVIAGARRAGEGFGGLEDMFGSPRPRSKHGPPRGTTLAIVATDLALPRRDLLRVAQAAHDGIARSVVPAHSATDGDTVFVVSTSPERAEGGWPGKGPEPYPGALSDLVSGYAAQVVQEAVVDAVVSAEGAGGFPSARETGTLPRKDPP